MANLTLDDAELLAWMRAACKSKRAQAIRLNAGFSSPEVAEICQTVHSAVLQWEVGNRVPRGRRALIYARLLRALDKESPA